METTKKELLSEVILEQLENIKTLTPGSKEHSTATEDICKLYRLHLEELAGDTDYTEKSQRLEAEMNMRERELELKERQLNEELERRDGELELKERELEMRSKQQAEEIALKEKELEIRSKEFESEQKLKVEQFKEERRDRAMDEVTDRKKFKSELIKWGVGIGVTLFLNELKDRRFANWLAAGLDFETNGTFTSKTFMGFIHNLKPSNEV